MSNTNHWQIFFNHDAREYDAQPYAQNSVEQVDFIIAQLKVEPGSQILDLGCGTGRHAVELARRGYRVTGVDFSIGMLAQARAKATAANVEVNWVHGDATQFTTETQFDGIICMTEAAVGLITPGVDAVEHDLTVLRNVNAALKPNARFVVEVPSAFRMLALAVRDELDGGTLDLMNLVYTGDATWETPDGVEQSIVTSSRNYTPTELSMYLRYTNFKVLEISGSSAQVVPVDFECYTIIAVAQKVAECDRN